VNRLLDATLAGIGLAIGSPALALAAAAIKLHDGGPVLYRQRRVGLNGEEFELLKLRTMEVGAEHKGAGYAVNEGDPRITGVGGLLRRLSVDEIPQLWNVVRGDMALVGPRPEVPHYADLSDPRWRRVLEVRPGITDPLTLKLRDEEALMPAAAEERERFYLETLQPMKLAGYLEYLSRRTAASDLGVLMATLLTMVRSRPAPTRDDLARRGRV
jgi:lipopolysaccharide/colanic/teichoic acid biosynthesis glycosyltransferase